MKTHERRSSRGARKRGLIGSGLGLAMVLALAGCRDPHASEPGEDESSDEAGEAECLESEAALAPLRRMSAVQYRNTISDLFGATIEASELFPASDASYHYSNEPDANLVTQLRAEAIMLAAEETGAAVSEGLDELWQCPADAADERACAEAFIADYGLPAFRRPLRPEERDLLLAVYDDARAAGPQAVALGTVVAAMLQMPAFLYFIEEGEPAEGLPADALRLTDYELATRLSYLLWDTMPDATLLALAAAGELETAEQIEAQARRLLDDARARPAIARFFREWVGVHELDPSAKDPDLFPDYGVELSAAMVEEFDRFVTAVVFAAEAEDGTLEALLTRSLTEVDASLASFYGLGPALSPAPGEWVEVELDPARRPGLLSRPAVLAEHANTATSSAVFRGHLVRSELLCDPIPAPPPGAMAMASFPPGSSQREQSEILQGAAECGACHVYMNPIGLGFEHYDATGAWRDNDENGPVDASGEVVIHQSNVTGTFDGLAELTALIASSAATHHCLVEQWSHHALGRSSSPESSCHLDALAENFVASAGDLDQLILDFVLSPAFRARRLPETTP